MSQREDHHAAPVRDLTQQRALSAVKAMPPLGHDGGLLACLPRSWLVPCSLQLRRVGADDAARYELSLPSAPNRHGTWRWIFLGQAASITQHRLDMAVATLVLRAAYHRHARSRGMDPSQTVMCRLVAEGPRAQDQLRLADLIDWTCKGRMVDYLSDDPPAHVRAHA